MTDETDAVDAAMCASCGEPLDELSTELETKDCVTCRSRARDGEELTDPVDTTV